MRQEQQDVREFMLKNEFKVGLRLDEASSPDHAEDATVLLEHASRLVEPVVRMLKDGCARRLRDDPRLSRAFLMLEEAVECMEALAIEDDVLLADGLADLAYVVLGTAETFRVPLKEAFDEVHRSNMTKTRQAGDGLLKAGKGAAYDPPNLEKIMRAAR